MKIVIKCPACAGKGKFKTLNTKCNFCHGKKRILLTHYLEVLNKKDELHRVLAFQKRTEKKPILAHA